MTNEKKAKIDYVKPQVLDLGPVMPALGGTCAIYGDNPTGKPDCYTGSDVTAICQFGEGGGYT